MENSNINNFGRLENNKQWEWSESDLLTDITPIKISALTHASKIGPLVTNCTLGKSSVQNENMISNNLKGKNDLKISVKNEYCINSDALSKSNEKQQKQRKEQFKKEKPSSSASSILKSPRKIEVLDYKTLNDTMLYKTIEKQRINENKQKEQEFIENVIKEEDNKLKKIHEKSQEDYKEWLAKKIESEKQLINEIERMSQIELEKHSKELNELRRKTENQLRMIAIDGILKYQKRFKAYYERIVKAMKSASMMTLPNCEEYNKTLKTLGQIFEQLKQKVKNEIIGPNEIKIAENLCIEIDKLEKNLLNDIEKFEKEVQNELQYARDSAALKQEQLQQEQNKIQQQITERTQSVTQQQQQQQQQQQNSSATTVVDASTLNQTQHLQQQQTPQASSATENVNTNNAALTYLVSSERLIFYNNIMAFYTAKVEAVKALQADETMKKYRFACQKAINTPVNAISGVSPQHLQDKFDKIFSFITGNPIKTSDGCVISTSDHPLGRDYCLLLLAKKFVGQGDSLVSSNAQAAFPIASIIVSIWKNVPDFGPLFLAYSFKESPYLVPYFLPQYQGQSDEDYFKSLGYRIVDGVLEKQDMYLKRQAGYMRLYATVMITESRAKDSGLQHPYGLENGWKWLCNLLNSEPLPDICATLIFEFLQIVGHYMWKLYGNQFFKILLTIQQEYFPKLSKVDEGGPKSRLEIFLQKVIQERKINKPAGTLSKHFW